jgi:hypothetical protein
VLAAPLDYGEKLEAVSSALAVLAQKARSGQGLTDGEQMAYYMNRTHAKKMVRPACQRFDDDLRPIE